MRGSGDAIFVFYISFFNFLTLSKRLIFLFYIVDASVSLPCRSVSGISNTVSPPPNIALGDNSSVTTSGTTPVKVERVRTGLDVMNKTQH